MERSEGIELGKGIGFDIASGELVHRFADLLFEHGARFFEAEHRAATEGGSVRSALYY